MAQKYDSPSGPPPPSYDATSPSQPPSAHIPPHFTGQTNQQNFPPTDNYYNQNQHQGQGYYANPQMGYAQQQQGPYGPQGQGGYYNGGYGQNGGYAPGYGPQGQHLDQRRGGPGFMEACLGALACCCCLELLF